MKTKHWISGALFLAAFAAYVLLHPGAGHIQQLSTKSFYTFIPPEPAGSQMHGDHYEYHLLSINAEGEQEVVSLSLAEPIDPGTYLRLYIDKEHHVTGWDEIRRETVPRTIIRRI